MVQRGGAQSAADLCRIYQLEHRCFATESLTGLQDKLCARSQNAREDHEQAPRVIRKELAIETRVSGYARTGDFHSHLSFANLHAVCIVPGRSAHQRRAALTVFVFVLLMTHTVMQ